MPDTKRPNIVCLISDDTDPFNLGCYGGDQFLTPNLDRLAAEGMQFLRANAVCPVCTPSRYAYLTGQYPSRCPNNFREENPVDDVCTITWNTDLAADQTNLATIFRGAGYTTGYTGKFHCGPSGAKIGLKPVGEPHFDPAKRHDPYDPEKQAIHRHNQERITEALHSYGWQDVRNATWGNLDGNPYHDVPQNLEWVTRGAVDFLDAHAADEEPFLLYVGYHTIHGPKHGEDLDQLDPLVTPAGILDEPDSAGHPARHTVLDRLRTAGLDTYHRNVGALWMDDSVGVIMKKLAELGLAEDTIFVFKADHGKFAKATVYQPGSHVPMIWRWPNHVPPGSRCYNFVQNIDFLPTLIDAAEITAPADYAMDGTSYLPHLTHGSTEPLRQEFYNEMGFGRSVQTDRWKYVALRYNRETLSKVADPEIPFLPNHMGKLNPEGGDLTAFYHPAYYQPDQLYEIQQDRGENLNLAGHPEYEGVLADMKMRLRKYVDDLPHPFPETPDPVQLSPAFGEKERNSRVLQPGAVDKDSVFGMRFW